MRGFDHVAPQPLSTQEPVIADQEEGVAPMPQLPVAVEAIRSERLASRDGRLAVLDHVIGEFI
jgi:hypothetical protein